jgi:hypothetical protein
MDQKIKDALARFEEIGPGADVSLDDLDRVQEFVTDLLVESGKITRPEATDLTRFLQWGHWSKGWNTGYGSGKSHGTPHFTLNGS